jgi:D-amino peptidase
MTPQKPARFFSLIAASLLLLSSISTSKAQNAPKLLISVDMEGLAGAVTGEQLGPTGFEYQRFRQFMTDETLAAIEGAREAGAGEILVADSHGNGQNLLIDQLPPDIKVVRSWPRELGMVHGIDDTFDGVIFLAYHASTANLEGVRAHTMSSANITSVKLNGVEVPEAGVNAAIAGYFDVPVIMISGDNAIVAEATALLGDIEGAVVKWSNSFHSATTLTPTAAASLIREKAKTAVERIGDFEPYKLDGPVTFDLSLKHYRPVELLGFLPIVERTSSHSIRYVGENMLEVSRFFQFVTSYNIATQP